MKVYNFLDAVPKSWSKTYVKKVKVRKVHDCSACGGEILPGEEVWFVVEVSQVLWKKYVFKWYYHYNPQINPTKISPNEYRKQVCSKVRGVW
jgi:ribosomal protein L24E